MKSPTPPDLDRRSFLRLAALAGSGLILGFRNADAAEATAAFAPNPFIQIRPDGAILLFAKNPEIGQGISTSLPMLIAEELEVDFQKVIVRQAPFDRAMGTQFIGGSQSVGSNHKLMREAGAAARQMLVAAAAATWAVPEGECHAEMGKVIHKSGRSLTYGELASRAATLPVPDSKNIALKKPEDFKVIGQWTPGVDNLKIITGQPLYGIDVQLPGMLHAVYTKCPVFGGQPVSANLDRVKQLPGVKDAFIVKGGDNATGLRSGVAIVAENTWAALNARRQLEVEWNEGPAANHSWASYRAEAEELAKKPGTKQLKTVGDFDGAYQAAAKTLEADYSYPFISHATMEPMNCTVAIENGKMKVWVGTQAPESAARSAGNAGRVKFEDVTLQVMRSGGGFGRRINTNYVSEAAAIAAKVGAPVKLTWDRTDDLHGGPYRAGNFQFLKGGIDASGKLVAWSNHFVTFGTNNTERPGEFADLPPQAFPSGNVPNFKSEQSIISTCLPMASWRAPGVGAYTFVMQSFVDELAWLAGKDPLNFRLEMIGSGYHTNLLNQVAKRASWGEKLPKGRGRGISFGGSSAQVAEVTVTKDGNLTVNKMTVVASAGTIINPSGALAQIGGSVMDGLSATWLQAITLEKGRIVEINFSDYPLLRMNQAPEVDIQINTGGGFPGMGEPYLPATAAAITNAIFAATGKRIRHLPIRKNELSWS